MKVSLNVEQGLVSQGWLSPKKQVHNLRVSIDYSPEEVAAIEAAGLGEYELIKDLPMTEKEAQGRLMIWPDHGGCIPIPVSFFVKTRERVFTYTNALKAQNAANELKQNLVHLKSAIEQTSAPRQVSFEL